MEDNTNKYKCYNCGKYFKDNSHLMKHKQRKTPCLIREVAPADQLNPLRCIFCNKILSNKSNHIKHLKICKIKNGGMDILADKVRYEQKIRILEEKDILRDEKDKQKDEELIQMKKQIGELQNQLKQITTCNATINNTTNINNITNNNQITINNYLTPNLAHLHLGDGTASPVSKIIYIERVQAPIALITLIWFNPAAPENFSIYLVNKNTKEVLTYNGASWASSSFDKIGRTIRDRAYEITLNIINERVVSPRLDPMVGENMQKNLYDEEMIKLECEKIYAALINGRQYVKEVIKL